MQGIRNTEKLGQALCPKTCLCVACAACIKYDNRTLQGLWPLQASARSMARICLSSLPHIPHLHAHRDRPSTSISTASPDGSLAVKSSSDFLDGSHLVPATSDHSPSNEADHYQPVFSVHIGSTLCIKVSLFKEISNCAIKYCSIDVVIEKLLSCRNLFRYSAMLY